MAKISNTLSYPNQSPIESGDYLIGTSSSSSPVPKQTKTFTLGDIANFTAETILDGDPLRIAMFSSQNTLINSLLFQDFVGNILTLDKVSDAPVDIIVNNKTIAKGELVVIPPHNFAIKVTKVKGKTDRIKKVAFN